MGRMSKSFFWVSAVLAAALCAALLASCENSLLDYFFKGIFYDGWKIRSWSEPAPVVDGETHLQGDAKRNGFPMNLVMGGNGKLHLIGWRVSARQWIYSTLEPGASRFNQSFGMVLDLATENPGGIGLMPGIDLISADVPMIVHSHGSSPCTLGFQDYNQVSGVWSSEEVLYSSTDDITRTFVFFLTSDFLPHIFYVTDETDPTPDRMYYTRKDGSKGPEPIDPYPPAEFIDDVGPVHVVRREGNEVVFIYTDTARQNLYHRTLADPTVSTIWSVPDASVSIGEITAAVDSKSNIHACFGTYKTADPLNTSYMTIRYIHNSGSSWKEQESISGSSVSGPLTVFFPISISVSRDRYGNDHLHTAYTVYKPPANFYFWYAYYEGELGWQISTESIDTINTNSFWTFPMIAVDPAGTAHIVYSWTQTELDRTLMYVRGTPGEPQD